MHYTDSTDIKEQNPISTKQRPIRILHVVGGMNRGGIETWLMHVLRHIDRDRFHMDFLVHTEKPCPYDDEIRALGSKIIPCLTTAKPWLYNCNFKRILREYGPYDVIHSHVHHFSGYVLWLAKQVGVPIRIAHSHNDTSEVDAHVSFLRRIYLNLMKVAISRYATTGLAASGCAGESLFGQDESKYPHWRVLYYGVDLTPFQTPVDGLALRQELGIPKDAFVLGHVGRFEEQKNHLFLLEIAAAVIQKEPLTRLLLIGEGSLRSVIEDKIKQMGLTPYVILAGLRSDVPQLIQSVMDVFLLPSFHEGLPVVGMEAQAGGLPLILSDVITEELDRVKPLIKRLSLSQGASEWAKAVLESPSLKSLYPQAESLTSMENSPFNIAYSVQDITKIYDPQ